MKKKNYMMPLTEVIDIETQGLLAVSLTNEDALNDALSREYELDEEFIY